MGEWGDDELGGLEGSLYELWWLIWDLIDKLGLDAQELLAESGLA